MMHLYKLVGKL